MPGSRRGGGVNRRCECRGPDGKRLGTKCPKLSRRGHARFEIHQELPEDAEGKRRRWRRTGYATKDDAETDLGKVRALLELVKKDDDATRRRVGDLLMGLMPARDPIPTPEEVRARLGGAALDSHWTVAELLDAFVAAKRRADRRRTTLRGYEGHIRLHLKPALGDYRADRLSVAACQKLFDDIDDHNEIIQAENEERRAQEERARWGKPGRPPDKERKRLAEERAKLAEMPPYRKTTGPGTKQAILRTLRAALNWGVARQQETGMTHNPARHVELATHRRPKGLLWTDERVAHWRETGEVPSPVMVWTPQQLGAYLDAAQEERLYLGLHVMAYHGPRRGEMCGQAWADVHLSRRRIAVTTARTVDGWEPYDDDPKTEDSRAEIAIDAGTVAAYREHRKRQLAEQEETPGWTDSGKVLTRPDGQPIHPEELSDAHRRVTRRAGLPPISLRDLRHGAASLVKAGGGDIHDAQKKLRHSSVTLTADTYTELFAEYEEELTERAAAVVPRSGTSPPGQPPAAPEEAA
ncbi:site-specific integrase [Streptomyces aidingensis]|uniref:Phage integrase, N-terminal SAM-like domain n=1 Tax=Streptomyces aidingensis TaxID=910347 RepID=A0A1I1PRY3_9ACTN|nr:site-specific integrase [Streptomyces aidingensis]SFD12651.1 Phage integrase, N-terminal SAM-like domain [Streptomyces aidingensis]